MSLFLWIALARGAVLSFGSTDGSIGFHAVASLHEFDGKAGNFSGSLDTTLLTGTLVLQAASLTTALGPRDERMREYCLETEHFSDIRFDVSSITGSLEGFQAQRGSGGIFLVGLLTIRDVSQKMQVPATYSWENGGLRLTGRVPLHWADFGIPDPSVVMSTLSPEITVQFDILAKTAEP